MAKSTPHRKNLNSNPTTRPRETGSDLSVTDLVPGDPPVPITVWRTARTDADTGRVIPARLAARLVAAYTRPGDVVIDVTTGHGLATVCLAGRRHHYPASFTDSHNLLVGPVTGPPAVGGDTDADTMKPGMWWVDDPIDADVRDRLAPGPARNDPHRGATALVVATWPLHPTGTTHQARAARLVAGAADLLHPGGCLILVVNARPGTTATPQDFSPLTSAASSAGLGYLQHIVAVTAATDGDAFVYHATDEELLALAHDPAAGQPTTVQLRVHADLLVFATDQAQPRTMPARHRHTDGGGRD